MSKTVFPVVENEKVYAHIREKMKWLRETAGLSQEEVASLIGCRQEDVAQWESNGVISLFDLYKFAWATGASLSEFDYYNVSTRYSA